MVRTPLTSQLLMRRSTKGHDTLSIAAAWRMVNSRWLPTEAALGSAGMERHLLSRSTRWRKMDWHVPFAGEGDQVHVRDPSGARTAFRRQFRAQALYFKLRDPRSDHDVDPCTQKPGRAFRDAALNKRPNVFLRRTLERLVDWG